MERKHGRIVNCIEIDGVTYQARVRHVFCRKRVLELADIRKATPRFAQGSRSNTPLGRAL